MNAKNTKQYKYRGLYCKRMLDRIHICYNMFNDKQNYDMEHIRKFERILWKLHLKQNPNTWPYRYW